MKLGLILTLVTLVSCGKHDAFNLKRMIGADYNNEMDKSDSKIKDIEKRLGDLEFKVENNIVTIQDLQLELDLLNDEMDENSNEKAALSTRIYALQTQINAAVIEIAELQAQESIVEFIDPCGDSSGFDEILLKTSTGKIVAYFEQGNKRFLTILGNGTYQTTDNQACRFKIVNGKVIEMGSPESGLLAYRIPSLVVVSSPSLTCIADDTAALGVAKVRVRVPVTQSSLIERVGGESGVILFEAGKDNFVTLAQKGTVKVLGQTKACNN